MASFREFVKYAAGSEENGDIAKTLAKLPPGHADLVRGWKWSFHPGNTLNGDQKHVGYMDDRAKEIAVSGPWNYSREFTVLHEIGHRVWERLPEEMKDQWRELVARTKLRQRQEPEELFCMAYANAYVKHKVLTHYHPEWMDFVKGIST